jgi:hypothetical protein
MSTAIENTKEEIPFLVISPNNTYKKVWDLFVCTVLIFSCTEVPYRLVFIAGDDDLTW